MFNRHWIVGLAAFSVLACSSGSANRARPPLSGSVSASAASKTLTAERPSADWPEDAQRAAGVVNADSMLAAIRTLSSDLFEGRAPASPGEEATVKYLVDAFKGLGLEPGNPDGTFVQKVPLVSALAEYRANFTVKGHQVPLSPNRDIVAASHRLVEEVAVADSEMMFVGYGVVAPEYGWDDFKDVDVRGKTIVMLVNDPQVVDPADPSRLDPASFKGKGLTYYGRPGYKYEIAAKKGAAAAIVVHETGLATYPFDVVVNSFGRETYDLVRDDRNRGRAAVDAWIAESTARSLLQECGEDFDTLKRAAASRQFRPVPLKAKFNASLKRNQRALPSRNVVAKIRGTDPAPGRYLVYSAHWDHLGRDATRSGDQIFHGALDNASGIAALLETAKAFRALKSPPRATVVFLATTAEECGFLGAKHYVEHPLYPLGRTLANINYDGLNVLGKTRDLGLTGAGSTSLEDDLRSILDATGRTLGPERDPEGGWSYRTDAFEFAKGGVPSIWYRRGTDVIGKPEGFGVTRTKDYLAHDYHKVTDVIHPDWDMSGAIDDVQVFFRLGYGLAHNEAWPSWKPDAEFHTRRPSP
jgi:Zn-dependent M28 family amino/carboxypeptidase